jgi:hypothetical protein
MAEKQGDAAQRPRPVQARPRTTGARSKPTTRIAVKPTANDASERDVILEGWRAAGSGLDEQLADAARRIGESAIGNSAFRDMAEQLARDAKSPISEAVREMAGRWEGRAAQLQQIQADALNARAIGPILANLPSPEVNASMAIEAQTARLVEISVRTSEQIGQLAQLAQATLEQQVQGVVTAAEMREDARRSAKTLTRLTIAIAALTAVIAILTAALVADALKLGPFAGA